MYLSEILDKVLKYATIVLDISRIYPGLFQNVPEK